MPNRARRRSHLQVSQTKAETATSHQRKYTIDFSSVQNIDERAVLEAVTAATPRHPATSDDDDLLADVACVALNRVQPRYIRHAVDLAFFLTEPERQARERAVDDAVDYAFGFVQARHLIAAWR